MISRIWHGWTRRGDADAYEQLLRFRVLPALDARIGGFRGAYVLRREAEDEVEFVVMTMFDSLDVVRQCAGEDYELAVIEPDARRLLSRIEERAKHYETVIEPTDASR